MDLMDLHSHSNVSDGSLPPREVVKLARDNGIRALALTDHDNLDGLVEAMAAAEEFGVELVPGVEISAEFPKGTMHIVGLYVWEGREHISRPMKRLQDARAERNPRMVGKLNDLGLHVTLEDVQKFAEGGQIGRPHMAQALMEKGYVKTFAEAFDRYLGKGKPAYEEKFRLMPRDAVAMIRRAGGVPALAHPFTLEIDRVDLEVLVGGMAKIGLEAIEVYSPEHTLHQMQVYRSLAATYHLAITGGTDFHGVNSPGIQLGRGRGNFQVPYALLEEIKKRRDTVRREFPTG